MTPRRAQRPAATAVVPIAATAALALCLTSMTGVARADHLEGDFGGEHERVGMVRTVADLAVANLNAVENPTDELYTLGRITGVENAVNHAYKSVVPIGERRAQR